jgi:hypothetical protein
MWESRRGRPSEANLDYLCRLYQTRPDRLGYGNDYTPADQSEEPAHALPETGAPDRATPALLGELAVCSGPLSGPTLSVLGALRRGMATTLESPMSETSIEQWERRAFEYGGYYQIVSPARILTDSSQDFADIRALLEQRPPRSFSHCPPSTSQAL